MTPIGWLLRGLYGGVFVVIVPAVLVLWARATAAAVPVPALHSQPAGVALALAGAGLIVSGWRALIAHGQGLPMNAFPPARLVRQGIYRWIRNPIYIGFGLTCAGVAIASGSASGLWLVTPTAALAAAALVVGFERPDLVRRFGPAALEPPRLSIPRGDDAPPTAIQRVAVVVWVLLPWVATWFAAQAIGRAPDAFGTALPFEGQWPVWQWTELFYVTAYLFVPVTILVTTSQRALRRLATSGSVATVIVTICWFTIPVVAANRPFIPTNIFGEMLAFEQRSSVGVAAFPAFHVLWALLAATAWSDDARHRRQRWRAWIGWGWAALVSLSCLSTAMHSVIDVAAAMILYVPVNDPARSWAWIRARTEAQANAWREWRFGAVRVISHGLFAAAAGGVGFTIIAMAVPPASFRGVVIVAGCVILGAGIWAQLLEGSSMLLRPFGWYGGVIGAVIGALAASRLGVPLTSMLAALALAAPWIQSIGRLRCLVQGCCHGGPAPERVGIRYHHRRSRVVQLAHLQGKPVHATPLYSIAANAVIGVIVLRLRVLGAPDVMVIGLYLILGGLARFVEEGYRAEPQTPIVAGLHSYQWLAILSALAGMWCTTLARATASVGFTPFSARIAIAAVTMAIVAGVAMGIDFPRSNRRFSRLAAAD